MTNHSRKQIWRQIEIFVSVFCVTNLKKVWFGLNIMYCRHSKYLNVHPDLATIFVSFWSFAKQSKNLKNYIFSCLPEYNGLGKN